MHHMRVSIHRESFLKSVLFSFTASWYPPPNASIDEEFYMAMYENEAANATTKWLFNLDGMIERLRETKLCHNIPIV